MGSSVASHSKWQVALPPVLKAASPLPAPFWSSRTTFEMTASGANRKAAVGPNRSSVPNILNHDMKLFALIIEGLDRPPPGFFVQAHSACCVEGEPFDV